MELIERVKKRLSHSLERFESGAGIIPRHVHEADADFYVECLNALEQAEKDKAELLNYIRFSSCGGRDCIGAGEVLSASQHQCDQCLVKTTLIVQHTPSDHKEDKSEL